MKKTMLAVLALAVLLSGASELFAENQIKSASDTYQETFKNEYDMKNRTGSLNYVTPTQEGSKYDHGTVEVAPPRETRPEGGMCPENYVCRALDEGRNNTCVYNTSFPHENGIRDCKKMADYCWIVSRNQNVDTSPGTLYAVACLR